VQLNNRGDVGSSSNTPSSQEPGAPDSGGSLSSLALDRCGKCHQFLFSRTESILLIGLTTTQQRPTTSVAGSNVRKLPGTPPRPAEPLAVSDW
jgi:hypothetical protein